MKKYMVLFLALGLVACSDGKNGRDGSTGTPGVDAPVPTAPTVSALEEKVAKLLADENEYRLGLGQTALTTGLSCTLQTFTGGDRIQASIAGHNTFQGLTTVGSFLLTSPMNQADSPISDGLSVLPASIRSVYKNLYLLRCQGQLVVTETGYAMLDITSDDGSVVYVDGSKLIDNDNNHGSTTVAAMKYLRKGVHSFRVDYAQSGGGSQSLYLRLNGEVLNPLLWAH